LSTTGLAIPGPDGVSTVTVAPRRRGVAAHETDGTTTCGGTLRGRATYTACKAGYGKSKEASVAVQTRSDLMVALLVSTLAIGTPSAQARSRLLDDPLLTEASPTLAPFQHVRFCLRYPAECKSNPSEDDSIELTDKNSELLTRVNHDVNAAIIPATKSYGTKLKDGWTIAPSMGDCNDYAVTKRHELLQSGLPAKALRLAVVKTPSEMGHLVLLVATTKGDMVLDNLAEAIRPWQSTDYHWLKIQSAKDARFWYDIKVSRALLSHADQRQHFAQWR
jgi:predicted transglutaminase-like cysteine proteinase